MHLNYKLSIGYKRDVLADALKHKYYILPKNKGNKQNTLKDVLKLHTEYWRKDIIGVSDIIYNDSHIETIEVDFVYDLIEEYFHFTKILLADFLIINLSDDTELCTLLEVINNKTKHGDFMLRSIIIITNNSQISNNTNPLTTIVSRESVNKQRKITSTNFIISTKSLIESENYNLYFNRRGFINYKMELKPFRESNTTIVLKKLDFENFGLEDFDIWNVNKNIVDVCKDCEFRQMCVDNRLPFKRKENEWYHKIECNYNPYIAKWEGEEGYKTLEECGVISNESGFSIDHDKIAKINAELWSEL